MDDQKESTSAENTEQLSPTETTEGAVTEAEGAETEVKTEAEEPLKRVFSQDEWDKRQSAWDTQYATKEKEWQEQISQLEKERDTIAQTIERKNADDFIRKVEEQGGDVDAARRLITREQQANTALKAAKAREVKAMAQEAKAAQYLKMIAADELIKSQKLDKDVRDQLLAAEDPIEMENIALKLALEKTKVANVPTTKVDSKVTSTKGVDLSKMSPEERIRWAYEHGDTK
jgi:hypothetical protein